jgi:hypothetical protein
MEQSNETFAAGLVHRAVAFGLAFATTVLVATSTAVVFTGNTQHVGTAIRVVATPVRALLGF